MLGPGSRVQGPGSRPCPGERDAVGRMYYSVVRKALSKLTLLASLRRKSRQNNPGEYVQYASQQPPCPPIIGG